MRTNRNKKIIAAIAVSATLTLPTAIMAKVSGQCGSCHTMHNSQELTTMVGGNFGDSGGGTTGSAGNDSLLRYGCVGCHTGTNDGGNVPFVYSTSASYGTDTLAGGNFKWVVGDGTTGHNVVGITDNMGGLSKAPGGSQTAQVTCAGTNGCHGDGYADATATEFSSIAGGHHDDGGTLLTADDTKTYTSGSGTMADSYRMLAGIEGIEDDDWEFTAAADDHNQYSGADSPGTGTPTTTISALCAKCHGDFHSDTGTSSPWVRHPTDFDMGGAKGAEYAFYNGGDGTTAAPYSIEAPVAHDDLSSLTANILDEVTVTESAGEAIVTCISCHRAHGSPYADLLRWNYITETSEMVDDGEGGEVEQITTTGMMAHSGSNNTGCFICHTTKDDL